MGKSGKTGAAAAAVTNRENSLSNDVHRTWDKKEWMVMFRHSALPGKIFASPKEAIAFYEKRPLGNDNPVICETRKDAKRFGSMMLNDHYLLGKRIQDDLNGEDEEGDDDVTEEALCVVCTENLRKVVIKPCKHRVLCIKCARTFRERNVQKCPMCNCAIETLTAVFG